MASHNCGTCFFFQEAGFAGNGWCLHAERAKSADGRTLVRRNELACRNDWGRSLWTDPKAATEAGTPRNPITVQAERPATQGEIGFMVKKRDGVREADVTAPARSDRAIRPDAPPAESEHVGSPGEDVVVSQISFMAPGVTGHRRLVDQVPADVRPPSNTPSVQTPSLPRSDAQERLPPSNTASNDPVEAVGHRTEPREAIRLGRDRLSRRSIRPSPADATLPAATSMPTADQTVMPDDPDRSTERMWRDDRGEPVSRREVQRDATVKHRSAAQEDSGWPSPVADQRSEASIPELPRGLQPAPIPGPVPAGELRRETSRREDRSAALPRMAGPAELAPASDTSLVQDSPRSSLPRMATGDDRLDRTTRRAPPAQRPVLPDLLPDDAFPRVERRTPSAASTPVSQARDEAIARRPVIADERSPIQRPMPTRRANEEMTPSPSWADSTNDPGERARLTEYRDTQPARPRPAVPRMAPAGNRPVPPPVRSIPTVAEANRAISDRGEARPAAQPVERTWSSGAVHDGTSSSREQTIRRDRIDVSLAEEREWSEPAPLDPPTPLRPAREDFGVYSSWLDLQSVEPRLSPHLQRACETCRDFRPSENGERGWCANPDSFTLRTVVNAGDLPCISSFGCWWVPFDDVWLSEAAIRDHRNPTPLLDQLFTAEEQGLAARQRRRS